MSESISFTIDEFNVIVKKCLKSQDVQIIDFATVRISKNCLVKITVKHQTEEKTLSFFAKTVSKSPLINRILFEDFKKIIPKFDPTITPKLYYDKLNLLLFEDVTGQGFKNSKCAFFGLEHVKVVLKTLAKFHAGSFAFEEIKSKETGKGYRLDQEYKLEHLGVDLKKREVIDLIATSLERNSEDDLSQILEDLEERQVSSKFRRTLCHSNLIRENIMFKFDKDLPVECKLINFKTNQYAPPICDVLQVIFFNTSEDLRQDCLERFLSHYHDCLKQELERYSLNIDEILPKEDLEAQTHHFLPLIKLETALLFHNLKTSDQTITKKSLEELKEILTCPLLSREDCYVIVKNKIGTTNYKLLSFTVSPLDQVNGYLGNYHKLQIEIKHKCNETINCFIKCMPKSKPSKSIVEDSRCFFKEIFIYQTLVPQMQDLGIDTINECLSSCYFHRSEELVVFDDISLSKYHTLPSQVPFNFSFLSMTLKKLAKFHASMLVFEEKMSKRLGRVYRVNEEYNEFLQEIFFSKNGTHAGAILFQAGVRSVLDITNLFPEIKNQDANFRKMWPNLKQLFFEVIKPSQRYRNVLSHGDLWTNNIMVRLEDLDCRFVDYQCTRYCPPAHDYLSVLYLTTDRGSRLKHWKEAKTLYHNELGEILASFDCDVGKICSFEEFEESVDYIRPQMVMQALMYNSFAMCTSEEISSFLVDDETCRRVFFEDRREYLAKMCQKSTIFKAKLKECVLDLYELSDKMAQV